MPNEKSKPEEAAPSAAQAAAPFAFSSCYGVASLTWMLPFRIAGAVAG